MTTPSQLAEAIQAAGVPLADGAAPKLVAIWQGELSSADPSYVGDIVKARLSDPAYVGFLKPPEPEPATPPPAQLRPEYGGMGIRPMASAAPRPDPANPPQPGSVEAIAAGMGTRQATAWDQHNAAVARRGEMRPLADILNAGLNMASKTFGLTGTRPASHAPGPKPPKSF